MATSSAFSGSFDEGAMRSAVLNTMLMGMPENPAERLTFVWNRDKVFSPDDPAGNPYDWTSTPVTDRPGNPGLPDTGVEQTLQVPYALEFAARPSGSETTSLGEIDVSRAIATLMDGDFEKIKTADYARIGDSRYRIQFDAPAIGLFGITVWQVFMEAEDSS